MAKPWVHAVSSAERFGGRPEDYLDIHELLDCSKAAMSDNRHRALTHTSWFLTNILERIFGPTITLDNGKQVSVRDVGEQHVKEDLGGIIPTAQDYLAEMEYQPWMGRGGRGPLPPSAQRLAGSGRVRDDNLVGPDTDSD